MKRAVIEVAPETRNTLNDARVDLYADAGQVLNADGRILFLLGVWRYIRMTDLGAEACRITALGLSRAGVGIDRRCRS